MVQVNKIFECDGMARKRGHLVNQNLVKAQQKKKSDYNGFEK